MRTTKPQVATPNLGIIKGLIIILLGFVLRSFYSLDGELGGIIWGWVFLALCLWRGFVALKRRKVKHVSYLGLGIWGIALIGAFYYEVVAIVYSSQF